MNISRRIEDDITILNLSGRLDLSSAADLKNASREVVGHGNCKLILNMCKVDFINSSGLGTLVSLLKDIRSSHGRLKLSNLAPYVREIFEITQLNNIFDICEDENHARKALKETAFVG